MINCPFVVPFLLTRETMVGIKGKILVVDDEHLVRWSVCRMLEAEGFETVEASSGREALQVMQNEQIWILITDLMMPEMSGIELIRRARIDNPDLGILVITAIDSPGPIDSALQAGAVHTFTKPIPFDELVGTIQRMV
jgi:two-component system response regulator AtoC